MAFHYGLPLHGCLPFGPTTHFNRNTRCRWLSTPFTDFVRMWTLPQLIDKPLSMRRSPFGGDGQVSDEGVHAGAESLVVNGRGTCGTRSPDAVHGSDATWPVTKLSAANTSLTPWRSKS